MKSKEILVNIGVTKNMGNYESLRLDYQMKVQLENDDKPGESIDKARNYLFDKMKARAKDRKDTVMMIWLEQLQNLIDRGYVNGKGGGK